MGESPSRALVLGTLAEEVRAAAATRACYRVAVDGVDGAGKSFFADELAAELRRCGSSVVRVSVDGFHNPREIRYRRGRDSPDGFFRDSYDYDRLVALVLEPLSPGGSGVYTPAVYDVATEQPVEPVSVRAPSPAILVLDGIFLHRDELLPFWDSSIWLEVPFEISIPRVARRGSGSADPGHVSNRRYVEGQRLYVRECSPARRATVVVDNSSLEAPAIVRRAGVDAGSGG